MVNKKPFKRGETFSRKDENVMAAEWKFLQKAQDLVHQKDNLYGLAISGGGIRSASFGIGVLQALASKDKGENLKKLITSLTVIDTRRI
jgi:predicted acylesterase/phospholipase RssA